MPGYYSLVNPTYAPAMRNILSITNGFPAIVTTTFDGIVPGDNGYLSGLIVRLIVPNFFGMTQANQLQGTITVLNSSQFAIDIDTTFFDPFVIPTNQPGSVYTPGQVTPIGEKNSQLTQATFNILPPQI
jgi:hypothetical protein